MNKTCIIPLTQGKSTVVDAEDYERLGHLKWCISKRYAVRRYVIDGVARVVPIQRVILDVPSSMEVDHINGDPLDNRRENLRICTHRENGRNTKKPVSAVTSEFKGVHYRPKTQAWIALITVDDKNIFLGCYKHEEDAALAYDAAARKFFGEFAKVNFPDRSLSLDDAFQRRRPLKKANATTPYFGVVRALRYNGWIARISTKGKVKHLGSFRTQEDAARAYDEAARKYHGDKARLNFP